MARDQHADQPLGPADPLSWRDLRSWAVLSLAAAFLGIGLLLIFAPRWGAALFGIPGETEPAQSYVRALGFRDLALALYLVGLGLFVSRAALSFVLGASVLIPDCDLALVASTQGTAAAGSLVLHAAGGACLAALALWCRNPNSLNRRDHKPT